MFNNNHPYQIRSSQIQGITLQNYNSYVYPAVELFRSNVSNNDGT